MKKISLIVLCTSLIYCAKKDTKIPETHSDTLLVQPNSQNKIGDSTHTVQKKVDGKSDETLLESEISVNEIAKLPSDIHGCGSYLSANESKYKSSEFIYLDNTQNAYMNLNGRVEKFDVIKNTQIETTLTNVKYNVKIRSNKIGDLEEGILLVGTIEITSKENSHKKTVQFYGASGC